MRLTVPPYQAALLTSRKVTQYRRPVDNRQPRVVRKVYVGGSQAHTSKPWTPQNGLVVPVLLSTTGETACHVEITGHRRQRHGDITPADLQALNADSLAEHARRWLAVHDPGWLWNATEPDRDHGDTLTTCARHLTDDQALERFGRRWADRQVWVLDLQLVAEPDEHLAPAGRHAGADEHGHTRSEALSIGAGRIEPVDDLHPAWQAKAEERWLKAQDDREQARNLARRLRAA